MIEQERLDEIRYWSEKTDSEGDSLAAAKNDCLELLDEIALLRKVATRTERMFKECEENPCSDVTVWWEDFMLVKEALNKWRGGKLNEGAERT